MTKFNSGQMKDILHNARIQMATIGGPTHEEQVKLADALRTLESNEYILALLAGCINRKAFLR